MKAGSSGALMARAAGLPDRTTQDEELAVTTGLPSQTQVIELLDGEFARAGYEIEDVVIDARAQPPRITVIADGDTALDLDTIAALSRSASSLLDAARRSRRQLRLGSDLTRHRPPADQRQALSPRSGPQGRVGHGRRDAGHRSSRRAARRHAEPGGSRRPARDWAVRPISLGGISKAVVQVEFSTPSQREMELATGRSRARRRRAEA